MWINQVAWAAFLCVIDRTNAERDRMAEQWDAAHGTNERLVGEQVALKAQKAKDDLHIDWLRHRVNALEKQNAQLLMKVTGVPFAIPEIVANRPGTMTLPPEFDTMPSFEDVGDVEADRLGLALDENGQLLYAGKS